MISVVGVMSGSYHPHPYQQRDTLGVGNVGQGQANEATDDEDSDGKNNIR